MSPTTTLLIALGVSADAIVVAAARGAGTGRAGLRSALLLGTTFGVFQGVMPLLGWLIGAQGAVHVQHVDHWVAFGLLAGVGGRMVLSGRHGGTASPTRSDLGIRLGELLLLGIATSIDALAVGLGLAVLSVDLLVVVCVMGLTTFTLSFLAALLGQRSAARLGAPTEVVGGLVLIGIGTHVLVSHLA